MSDQEASRSPELEELLSLANTSFLADVHTSMPGRIEEYFPKEQKADIKPLLKRRIVHEDGSELLESLPVIPQVPIHFARGGGFFQTLPLKKGDLVQLHFQERSIDNYLSGDGEDTDPDEFRMHDLSDAVATPGFYPFKCPIKDISAVNFVIGKDDGGIQIHLTPDGVMELKLQGASVEAVALGNAFQIFWDALVKPLFDAHGHVAPPGGGLTGPPLTPLPSFDKAIISKFFKLPG